MAVDEIEFRRVYNDAVSATKPLDASTSNFALLVLQLIDALSERITEMQEQEEEDE